MRADCSKCEHCHYPSESCFYEFERAAGAAGQSVDNIYDVYFCRDYSNVVDGDNEEDDE